MTNFDLIKNIEFDNSYNHVLDFEDIASQEAYFDGKVEMSFDSFSVVRENEEVKIPANINEINGINYCRYVNTINNVTKTFYAFIVRKEYVNPVTTRLILEIDVFQTYMFDFEIKESFVERQHEDRFTKVGSVLKEKYNTMVEGIEKGSEFVKANQIKLSDPSYSQNLPTQSTFRLYWAHIVTKENIGKSLTGDDLDLNPTNVKGMPTNIYYYISPVCVLQGGWANPPVFSTKIGSGQNFPAGNSYGMKLLSEDPNVISITFSKYCPFNYTVEVDTVTGELYNPTRYTFKPQNFETSGVEISNVVLKREGNFNIAGGFLIRDLSVSHVNKKINAFNKTLISDLSIDNLRNIMYEPKLKTHEFSFLELKIGDMKQKFNYEDFDEKVEFELVNAFSINQTQAFVPLNYKGQSRATDEILQFGSPLNEFPLRTDAWQSYLSQHKASLVSGFVTSALQSAGSIALGVMTGGTLSPLLLSQGIGTASSIISKFSQIQDLKNTPDEVKKTSFDLVFSEIVEGIEANLNVYQIKEEFMKKCFDFFTHFGYKTNALITPNLKSRYYYNFIKTTGCNIVANLDNNVIQKLKQIFDNGTTIWHYRNSETFKGLLNYDYENVEMSLLS